MEYIISFSFLSHYTSQPRKIKNNQLIPRKRNRLSERNTIKPRIQIKGKESKKRKSLFASLPAKKIQ